MAILEICNFSPSKMLPFEIERFPDLIMEVIPDCDPVIREFVTEAVKSLRHDLLLAAAFLVGAASEKAICLLIDAYTEAISSEKHKEAFKQRTSKNRMISKKYEEFLNSYRSCKTQPTEPTLVTDSYTILSSLFTFYRLTRNEVGHPEIAQGFRWTTNNRMELMALIVGLEALKYKCFITVHSDLKYLLGAFKEKWIERWKANGWRTKSRSDVINIDLWKRLDHLLSLHHPKFCWVKGHSGHPENKRCDKLAVDAARGSHLMVDKVFEEVNPFLKDENKSNNQIQRTGDPRGGSTTVDL